MTLNYPSRFQALTLIINAVISGYQIPPKNNLFTIQVFWLAWWSIPDSNFTSFYSTFTPMSITSLTTMEKINAILIYHRFSFITVDLHSLLLKSPKLLVSPSFSNRCASILNNANRRGLSSQLQLTAASPSLPPSWNTLWTHRVNTTKFHLDFSNHLHHTATGRTVINDICIEGTLYQSTPSSTSSETYVHKGQSPKSHQHASAHSLDYFSILELTLSR